METVSKNQEEQLERLGVLNVTAKSQNEMLKVVCTRQDRMVQMMGEMKSMLAQLTGSKTDGKEKPVEGNVQGKGFEGHSSLPFTETAIGVSKVIKTSVTSEDSKKDIISGSDLVSSNDNVKVCDIVVNDEHFYPSMNEIKNDAEKFRNDGSVFGFCSRTIGHENYSSNEDDTDARGEFEGNGRLPKIDFPPFDGEGPREWLREAMKYFQLHQTPDELKLGVAKMHLEGKAYIWFYGFSFNHPSVDWDMFSSEVCRRFAENNDEEEDMEMETDETGDPTLSNGNHHENEVVVINAPKVEGKRSGDVVFSREAQLKRLLECNGDEVLKAEGGAKVQKFTEWALKCSSVHSHCQENRDEVGYNSATAIQLHLSAFQAIVDLASNHLMGKDFIETIDAECFRYALFFSSIDHDWASGISATSIQRLLGMLVEGGANNVNQAYVALHYLLNPRMVKRMRQLLTTSKEDLQTFNLEDKVNLRGRDVMDWAIIYYLVGLY